MEKEITSNTAAWLRREDYSRWLEIFEDRDNFPPDYDTWATNEQAGIDELAKQGIMITPITIDPDGFIAFCKREGLRLDGRGRAYYSSALAEDAKGEAMPPA